MRRRDFITSAVAVAAVAACSFAARAQRTAKLQKIGMVSGFSDDEMQPLLRAFRQKLGELGWAEGRNISIDGRFAAGDFTKLASDVGALVASGPDVIVAMGTPGLTAVQNYSRTVPVVFTLVADPVKQGFVQSLARPGGHATGFTNFEFPTAAKWLEILKELSPQIERVQLLANASNAANTSFAQFIETAGPSFSVAVSTAAVRNAVEIEEAITDIARHPKSGLVVLPDSLLSTHRDRIIELSNRLRLPAVYAFRAFAATGGLLCYGLDVPEVYRQAAVYVDRILHGTNPADLPVQAPNKFELIVNLKTAKAIGIEVPPTLLARADEVIE